MSGAKVARGAEAPLLPYALHDDLESSDSRTRALGDMTSQQAEHRSAGRLPRFPKGVTTCRAAVLASLLAPGEFDTSGMFAPGAICLNVVMRALIRRYRWPIVRTDFATATGWATSWALPHDAIGVALDERGVAWLEAVRAARMTRDSAVASMVAR